ncbi:unnamed protein product [Parnassius apollo]|uniref:(apollo) hypothetical protein n=1 Tax=Parnassius apollo TaxID=110799 RepID=A0A8S3XBR8_PARAO|nr:unnamed protein product [Parnassius apollo]
MKAWNMLFNVNDKRIPHSELIDESYEISTSLAEAAGLDYQAEPSRSSPNGKDVNRLTGHFLELIPAISAKKPYKMFNVYADVATVITAFRVRDLPKTSHEGVSEFRKKQKCENCDVNKLDTNRNSPVHKTESDNKENKQYLDDKIEKTKRLRDETDDDSDEDDDEGNENLIYLKQLASKWQDKQKASGIFDEIETKPSTSKKKVNIASSPNIQTNEIRKDNIDSNGNSENDRDHDRRDQQKKVRVVKKTKEISKDIQLKTLKRSKVDDEDSDDEDDEDDENDNRLNHNKRNETNIEKPFFNPEKMNINSKPLKIDKTIIKEKISKIKEIDAKEVIKPNENVKMQQTPIKTAHKNILKKENEPKDKNIEKILDIPSANVQDEIKLDKVLRSDVKKPNEKLPIEIIAKDKLEIKKVDEVLKITTISKGVKEQRQESNFNGSREENRLKQLTNALFRRNLLKSEFEDFYAFFPTFAPNFTRVQNPECRRHGQILLRQLRGSKLWALNMLDATGKVPSGILQGNGIQLGNFDQCLGSRARVQLDTGSVVRVQGKYCLARIDLKAEHPDLEIPVHLAQAKNLIKSRIDDPGHFVPRFSTLSWGVCVPSPCSPEDVEGIVRDAIKHYQYSSGVSIRVRIDHRDCQMQNKQAWWEEWSGIPTLLTLSIYGVVILLVLIATAQDFVAKRKVEESKTNTTKEKAGYNKNNTENEEKSAEDKQSPDGNIISAFSLYRTVKKLVAPATSDEISCIHGVRAIATVALLVAHKFLPVAVTPYTNRVKISEVVSSPLWSWCRAGWIFTDCFLLLSGTLTAHRISSDNDSGAFKRIFSRYLRLTPALLAVLLFYAYVWDKVSIGPMWGALVTKNVEVCQEGWWWNVLYLQNYFGFENMCAPQTHQLALDMQLSILAGFVVWAMQSDLPMLRALVPTLHVWTAFSRYKTAKEHRLTMLAYHGVSVSQLYRTARLSYTSVIHRSTSYLIGLSLGLALKNNTYHSRMLMTFGWFVSGILWFLVLWAGFDSGTHQYRYSVTFAAQYAALAPISSALAIAWLIYAVHSGHCDFLQKILCSRPLTLISRLSYALYLCQFIVFLTNAATIKTSSEFSLISLINIQEISLIFLSSILLTLTFVIPMQSLPKILFLITNYKSDINNKFGSYLKKSQDKPEFPPTVRNKQTLIAHREVLEEIPEVEIEYENRRESTDGLDEILEEEEDDEEAIVEGQNRLDEEDLEIIEEEGQGINEDFWINRQDNAQRRAYSRNSDRDLDDWEVTGNGNDQDGAQNYRYS